MFYILSTSKSTECYKDVFENIERVFKLKPKGFTTDFEAGLRKALAAAYPRAVLNGCWFHYRKCLLRKIRKFGISKLWSKKAQDKYPKKASNAKRIYQMFGMLPLLPPQNFLSGYEYIQKEAAKCKLTESFGIFFAYFDRTWVVEVRNR